MGLFDKKPAPGPGKYQPPQKKDESLFKGRSQISKYEIHRSLTKGLPLSEREALKRELKLPDKWKSVDSEIKKLEDKVVDFDRNGMITKPEIMRANKGTYSPYWQTKKDIIEKRKDGITTSEKKEIARDEKRKEIFKKKFGI